MFNTPSVHDLIHAGPDYFIQVAKFVRQNCKAVPHLSRAYSVSASTDEVYIRPDVVEDLATSLRDLAKAFEQVQG